MRKAQEIDPRALWFSRVFFLRKPLPAEDPELIAAVEAVRRRWPWYALAYVAGFFPLLVLPGLLREQTPAYYATSILLPHLILYLLAMMVAYAWLGFRVNLGTYRQFMTGARRDRLSKGLLAAGVASLLAGGVVGYFSGRVGDGTWPVVDQWVRDMFSPGVLAMLFLVVITSVPELIARLRLREHELGERVRRTEAASEQLARQTVESELRLLQAQVEPHFLYNTLANLRYLVSIQSADALRMTDALIDYLRTSVPDMRAHKVTLGREIDHATHYLELMQMRMGDRLKFSVDLPEQLRAIELPPLMVLTLVENAIKHGVTPRVEGGDVQITVSVEPDDRIRIAVTDTGAGTAAPIDIMDVTSTRAALADQDMAGRERLSTQTGLASIRGRLALTYGDAAQIRLRPNAPRGVVAEMLVPRRTDDVKRGGRVSILYGNNDAELSTIAGKLVEKLHQPELR